MGTETLRNFSTKVAMVATIISAFLFGAYLGVSACSGICEVSYPKVGIALVSDLDPYGAAFGTQRIVTVLLMGFLILSLVKSSLISRAISFLLVLYAAWANMRLAYYKYFFWEDSDPYLRLYKDLVFYDLLLVVLLVSLVIINMISFVRHSSSKSG